MACSRTALTLQKTPCVRHTHTLCNTHTQQKAESRRARGLAWLCSQTDWLSRTHPVVSGEKAEAVASLDSPHSRQAEWVLLLQENAPLPGWRSQNSWWICLRKHKAVGESQRFCPQKCSHLWFEATLISLQRSVGFKGGASSSSNSLWNCTDAVVCAGFSLNNWVFSALYEA